MVVVVKGVGALHPKALTGLKPDGTMRSHQRVRGETQRQRVVSEQVDIGIGAERRI
jgi:hypothetical protein